MTPAPILPDDGHSARRLLYIGSGEGLDTCSGDDLRFLPLMALTRQVLAEMAPDLVVFSLIAQDHDAVAVIETLQSLGFRGGCLVLAPALPNPQAIEAELRRSGPAMQIWLRTGQVPF